MEKTTGCANHVCDKKLDVAKDTHLKCPLCLNPDQAYCSEECRVMDWVKHACPNVIQASAASNTAFLPFFDEDLEIEEHVMQKLDPSCALFQTYQVVQRGTDDVVREYQVPPFIGTMAANGFRRDVIVSMGRGLSPDKAWADFDYMIIVKEMISGKEVQLRGNMKRDTIYKGNPDPRVAHLLGGPTKLRWWKQEFLDKEQSSIIFWPSANKDSVFVDQEFPLQGELDIQFYLVASNVKGPSDKTSHAFNLSGPYDLSRAEKQGRFMGAMRKRTQSRLRAKFGYNPDGSGRGRVDSSVANMFSLRGTGGSMTGIVTFEVPPRRGRGQGGVAIFRDIEFAVPKYKVTQLVNVIGGASNTDILRPTIPPKKVVSDAEGKALTKALGESGMEQERVQIQSPLKCNAHDVNQVVGLTMAMELRAARGDKRNEAQAAVVRAYARDLLDNKKGEAPEHVPVKINTAIRLCIEGL